MNADDLKKRTKCFGLEVIALVEGLPNSRAANTIANQLLRSAVAVGANYRSACRGKSKPDFIAKACIALEEADKSLYWMELLEEAKVLPKERLAHPMKEADELVAILTATIKTSRSNLNR